MKFKPEVRNRDYHSSKPRLVCVMTGKHCILLNSGSCLTFTILFSSLLSTSTQRLLTKPRGQRAPKSVPKNGGILLNHLFILSQLTPDASDGTKNRRVRRISRHDVAEVSAELIQEAKQSLCLYRNSTNRKKKKGGYRPREIFSLRGEGHSKNNKE